MSGTWTTVDIAGRPADLYDPANQPRPRLAVLYLHDADGQSLRGRDSFTRPFDELGLGCLCPQGGPSWWVDRPSPAFAGPLTPERFLLDEVVPWLRDRRGLGPRQVGLLGAGMGGQAALRLAFKRPDLFPVVAGIASAIDYYELYGRGTALDETYDSKEQCRQDTAPLHVHPSQAPPHILIAADPDDPWFRGNDRLHEKLGALGIAHEIDFTKGGGHSWAYIERLADRAVRFVRAGLVQEGRRLL
jgi:S-formylglutathione hydrolase